MHLTKADGLDSPNVSPARSGTVLGVLFGYVEFNGLIPLEIGGDSRLLNQQADKVGLWFRIQSIRIVDLTPPITH